MLQLLTRLRDQRSPSPAFRNAADRMIRCVFAMLAVAMTGWWTDSATLCCATLSRSLILEEALAMAPDTSVFVTTSQQQTWRGVESATPFVAIGIGNGGRPLLQAFESIVLGGQTGARLSALIHLLLSLQHSHHSHALDNAGSIAFGSRDIRTIARSMSYLLPSAVRSCNVLLVDTECVTGTSACQAIEVRSCFVLPSKDERAAHDSHWRVMPMREQVLRTEGVQEHAIYFTCVLASRDGVQRVLRAFSGQCLSFVSWRARAVRVLTRALVRSTDIHIVTAAVDPAVDRSGLPCILPGCGRFLSRYYDADVDSGRLI